MSIYGWLFLPEKIFNKVLVEFVTLLIGDLENRLLSLQKKFCAWQFYQYCDDGFEGRILQALSIKIDVLREKKLL